MKLTAADWRKLRLSLVIFVLFCLGGGALAFLSLERQQQAHRLLGTAQAHNLQAQAKLKQVREEESEIKLKAALFSNLAARGVIGEEQRLDWVELLRDIRSNRRLLDIQYEFSPQQPLDHGQGPWSFQVSSMRLQLQLLHEEDLLNVLADLRNTAKAQVLVRSCEVSRQPRPPGDSPSLHANLKAQCLLDWITLRGPQPAETGRTLP